MSKECIIFIALFIIFSRPIHHACGQGTSLGEARKIQTIKVDASKVDAAKNPLAVIVEEASKESENATNQTANAGKDGAKDAKADKDTKKLILTIQEPEQIYYNYVTLNSGFYLLNPYNLTTNAGSTNKVKNVLQRGDSEAVFFVELAINNIWAWNPERRDRTKDWSQGLCSDSCHSWLKERMDLQARISYFLHGGGSESTAATIVGAGDFAGELTLGLNLFRILTTNSIGLDKDADFYDKTSSAQSFGLVASYGGTTDRSSFDVHHRWFVGPAYRAAFKVPGLFDGATKRREALVSVQLGYAGMESVEFINSSSRVIKTTNGDLPDYRLQSAYGFEAEFYYPIGRSAFVTGGTRIYGGQDPNPWNAYLAMTFPLEKLTKLFQ